MFVTYGVIQIKLNRTNWKLLGICDMFQYLIEFYMMQFFELNDVNNLG